MKKFVYLTYGIAGFGGGQNYISNKIEYYQNLDFKVYVIYHLDGEVKMPSLKNFKSSFQIRELNVPINYFSSSKRDRIINKIKTCIDYAVGDDVIIESHNVNHSMWGELLAKAVRGKHFYYVLGENDVIKRDDVYRFLRFKLDRKEIAGIVPQSIPNLFSKMEQISPAESFCLTASAGVWWQDYDVEAIDRLPKANYNIGIFSRLEKPFVLPSLIAVANFINSHLELNFNIVIVGDTDDKQIITNIEKLFVNIDNANLVLVGALIPPPKRFVDKCHLCIGVSGCALLTSHYGRLTISIDGNDNMPIGLMDFTTNEYLFRKNEPLFPLEDWLERVFIEKEFPFKYDAVDYEDKNYQHSEIHHKFIEKSCLEKQYYNMTIITSTYKDRLKGCMIAIKSVIRKIVGERFYFCLHNIKKSIS